MRHGALLLSSHAGNAPSSVYVKTWLEGLGSKRANAFQQFRVRVTLYQARLSLVHLLWVKIQVQITCDTVAASEGCHALEMWDINRTCQRASTSPECWMDEGDWKRFGFMFLRLKSTFCGEKHQT